MSNKSVKILIVAVQLLALTNAQNFCFFDFVDPMTYACKLIAAQYSPGDDFTVLMGPHQPGQNIMEVSLVYVDPGVASNVSTIPNQIFDIFPNMRVLDFSNVRMQNIQRLENCEVLEELHVNHNEINHIVPTAFAGCTSLEVLNLESNRLEEFEAVSVGLSQTALKKLNLRTNSISRLTADSFRGLSKLKNLNLDLNHVYHVAANTFFDQGDLEELTMNGNQLAILNNNMFVNHENLTTLMLNYNRIEALEPFIVMHFPNVRNIGFLDNVCASFELFLPQPSENEENPANLTACYDRWIEINSTPSTQPTTIEISTPSTPPTGETPSTPPTTTGGEIDYLITF